MRPEFAADEPVNVEAAKAAALTWLEACQTDADLAQDTRVAVPIYADPLGNTHRIWATLGVRLAKLDAEYARPPKIRPAEEEWRLAGRPAAATGREPLRDRRRRVCRGRTPRAATANAERTAGHLQPPPDQGGHHRRAVG